jgi:hypothetical protein
VKVTALLVDNVRTAPEAFYTRYEALSTTADVIMYNGHAGLGANVRALAREGKFVAGKYLVMFMDGCDTFAYVDGYMAQTRAALNADDPTGTKYLDIVTNGMPAFFSSMSGSSVALIKGLMKYDAPLTYEQMFASIDSSQVVVVTGEEDNVFYPGYVPGNTYSQTEAGFVNKGEELRYNTAEVPAGKYTVTLAHDPAHPGGDADLFVKVGAAPTTSVWDCRPYKSGSNEVCTVTVTATTKIYMSVVGYASTQSYFTLTVKGEGGGVTPPPAWAGVTQTTTVTQNQEWRYDTGTIAAGRYVFTLSGNGDADLYVKAGSAPTTASWDCRPYKSGSAEECVLTLSTPNTVHVMVRGYAATSTVTLVGKLQNL